MAMVIYAGAVISGDSCFSVGHEQDILLAVVTFVVISWYYVQYTNTNF